MAQRGSSAIELICRYGGSDTAAADQNGPLGRMIGNGFRGCMGKIGVVVVWYILVGAEVENFVPEFTELRSEFVLQFESGVVRSQCNSHVLMIVPYAR